ncbi:MAG: histidine kinase [Flavobacteriales bacterium]|nr:histidine kinase [Flavobacteriales bacterium]
MPLHYNLTKVYAISDRKLEVIQGIIVSFILDTEKASIGIARGIKKKKYKEVLKRAKSIKDSIELFGMDTAYDNLLHIMTWAKSEGKRKEIRTTYAEFQKELEEAHVELQKDYNLMNYIKAF